jgi:hypothetical protein
LGWLARIHSNTRNNQQATLLIIFFPQPQSEVFEIIVKIFGRWFLVSFSIDFFGSIDSTISITFIPVPT